MKHTPAPWQTGPVLQKDGRAIFITDETKPGKWQRRLDDKSGVFTADDARLIAAAPDLLAALTAVEKHYAIVCEVLCVDHPMPGGLPVLKQIRAAIAKATQS